MNNNPSYNIGWEELNLGISKVIKNYCGELKYDDLLKTRLQQLEDFELNILPRTFAYNPHELMRLLEVYDILTVSSIILNACLLRKSSSKPLNFSKPGQPGNVDADKLITLRQANGSIISRKLKVDVLWRTKGEL